jgi:hypothetical protein
MQRGLTSRRRNRPVTLACLLACALCAACARNEPAAEPAPPAPAAPIAVAFDDIEQAELAGKLVTVDGYFSAPPSMFSFGIGDGPRSWKLKFSPRPEGRKTVEVSVYEGDEPNRMLALSNPYDPVDLRLRTASGELIGPEDRVRITAKVGRSAAYGETTLSYNTLMLEQIELLPKEAEIEPVEVPFDAVCTRSLDGQAVAVEGYLSAGALVLSYKHGARSYYTFYLKRAPLDSDGMLTVRIFAGTGPNEVEPLGENFDESKVRFRTADGEVRRLADRVRVSGDLIVETGADGQTSCTLSRIRIDAAKKANAATDPRRAK